ncbi:hypothetical protein HDA39_004962 [Kribbella italica]|uniref:Uncharacterized protein n=1 Tax=Kribbella italica TaxID=1540520 RepID=A0A7W9JB78_9ACTN|nr:hypothetical protein [Kribbella italica]
MIARPRAARRAGPCPTPRGRASTAHTTRRQTGLKCLTPIDDRRRRRPGPDVPSGTPRAPKVPAPRCHSTAKAARTTIVPRKPYVSHLHRPCRPAKAAQPRASPPPPLGQSRPVPSMRRISTAHGVWPRPSVPSPWVASHPTPLSQVLSPCRVASPPPAPARPNRRLIQTAAPWRHRRVGLIAAQTSGHQLLERQRRLRVLDKTSACHWQAWCPRPASGRTAPQVSAGGGCPVRGPGCGCPGAGAGCGCPGAGAGCVVPGHGAPVRAPGVRVPGCWGRVRVPGCWGRVRGAWARCPGAGARGAGARLPGCLAQVPGCWGRVRGAWARCPGAGARGAGARLPGCSAQVPGCWGRVRGARVLGAGARVLGPGAWCPGAWRRCPGAGAGCGARVRAPRLSGAWVRVPVCGGLGAGVRVLGAGALVWCPGTGPGCVVPGALHGRGARVRVPGRGCRGAIALSAAAIESATRRSDRCPGGCPSAGVRGPSAASGCGAPARCPSAVPRAGARARCPGAEAWARVSGCEGRSAEAQGRVRCPAARAGCGRGGCGAPGSGARC